MHGERRVWLASVPKAGSMASGDNFRVLQRLGGRTRCRMLDDNSAEARSFLDACKQRYPDKPLLVGAMPIVAVVLLKDDGKIEVLWARNNPSDEELERMVAVYFPTTAIVEARVVAGGNPVSLLRDVITEGASGLS